MSDQPARRAGLSAEKLELLRRRDRLRDEALAALLEELGGDLSGQEAGMELQ